MADPTLRQVTVGPTAAPKILGPGLKRFTKTGTLYRLDVFPGTHTGIAFPNAKFGPVVSNNSNVVASDDSETWIDSGPGAAERTIHFYAKAAPGNPTDTTLFLIDSGTPGSRAIFQIRRVPFPPMSKKEQGRIFLKLQGLSIALNQDDGKIDPYNLTENISVPNSMPHGAALDAALKAAKGGKIDHLVINAHGREIKGTGRAEIELGDHFHPGNVASWDKLAGKVRYIWLQGCVIGFDNEFLNEISRRTGAWVTAPANLEIASLPSKGKGVIDHVPTIYKYFNASAPRDSGQDSAGVPRAQNTFFRHARERASSSLGNDVAFLLLLPSPP